MSEELRINVKHEVPEYFGDINLKNASLNPLHWLSEDYTAHSNFNNAHTYSQLKLVQMIVLLLQAVICYR